MPYQNITLDSFLSQSQAEKLNSEQKEALKILSLIFPFKTNKYVLDELIDWYNFENDPIYQLNFPQIGMLGYKRFNNLKSIMTGTNNPLKSPILLNIKSEMQQRYFNNVQKQKSCKDQIKGIYHGLKNTAFLFPAGAQNCHAYCNYCLRFIRHFGYGTDFFYTASQAPKNYLDNHSEIQDVIISGGDAFFLSAQKLQEYIIPLLKIESLQAIRFSSKVLTWWPYRFVSDDDADELLNLFELIIHSGKHCTIMAHFSHPRELQSNTVTKAIKRIQQTGTIIRTQSPLVNHVNNNENIWIVLWHEQVKLGLIPYYMFLESSFSLTDYFKVPICQALSIFTGAQKKISGLCRTVRGPVYNHSDQKLLIDGTIELNGKKVFLLKVLHSLESNRIGAILITKYCENASSLEQLKFL